jgi:mRNA interferase MazF
MKRGDVVEVDWAFSDQTGSKIRPAVVVRADYLSSIIDDTILVQITGQIHGITGTEVVIDPAQEPLSGLAKRCVASCTNIMTYAPNFIIGVIGYLSDGVMKDIDDCLKAALDLR